MWHRMSTRPLGLSRAIRPAWWSPNGNSTRLLQRPVLLDLRKSRQCEQLEPVSRLRVPTTAGRSYGQACLRSRRGGGRRPRLPCSDSSTESARSLPASSSSRAGAGDAAPSSASLHGDRVPLGIRGHVPKGLLAAIRKDERNRVAQTLASVVFRLALPIGSRNLGGIRDIPVADALEDGPPSLPLGRIAGWPDTAPSPLSSPFPFGPVSPTSPSRIGGVSPTVFRAGPFCFFFFLA